VHRDFPDTIAHWVSVNEAEYPSVPLWCSTAWIGAQAVAQPWSMCLLTDEVLPAQLDKKLVGCLMKLPTRRGVFIEA
jgi:hypothetical protein